MRKVLLAAVALGGLLGMTSVTTVFAAPVATGLHVVPTAQVTQVDYYYNHRHWHHRHWDHGHWRYWD